jgi:hypothetical protein
VTAPFLVICFCGVFCLAPLSLYLLWIALVARRDRATVIAGPWDFTALVAGLSGFILFGGGVVLYLFQSNFRYWMRGNMESFRAAWGNEKYTWLLLSFAYVALVISIIALTLLARRRSLVVYNVDPDEFEATVSEVFEHLGRPVERRGNLWMSGVPLFELDRFEAGQTVTLRWVSDDRLLFQEIDRLLREALGSVRTPENPAARWLMAIAGVMGFWAVFCFGLMMFFVFS